MNKLWESNTLRVSRTSLFSPFLYSFLGILLGWGYSTFSFSHARDLGGTGDGQFAAGKSEIKAKVLPEKPPVQPPPPVPTKTLTQVSQNSWLIEQTQDKEVITTLRDSGDKAVAFWQEGQDFWFFIEKKRQGKPDPSVLHQSLIESTQSHDAKGGCFVVFRTHPSVQALARPTPKGWQITFTKQKEGALQSLEIKDQPRVAFQRDDKGIQLTHKGMGDVHIWHHPFQDITYGIVPLKQPGFFDQRTMGPLVFPGTLQGIVIRMAYAPIQMEKTSPDTVHFALSSQSPFMASPEDRSLHHSPGNGTFWTAGLQKDVPENWEKKREKIQELLRSPRLTTQQESALLFDGARLYMASGHFAEALGLMDLVDKKDDRHHRDPQYLFARSIASVLMGDLDHGIDFQEKLQSIAPGAEASFCEGVCHLYAHKPDGLPLLMKNLSLLQHFPHAMRRPICIEAAKKSLENHVPGGIFLDYLDLDRLSPQERALVDFLRHVMDEKNKVAKDFSKTLELFTHSPNPYVATKASLMSLEGKTALSDDDLTHLKELHRGWRGDTLESAILHRIIKGYRDKGDKITALEFMAILDRYCPFDPKHAANQQQIQRVFSDLFFDPKALKSHEKIRLYQRIQDVLPKDFESHKILFTLGQAYVDMGLWSKALSIFRHLSKQSVDSGMGEKVENALIRLYEKTRKPKDALGVVEAALQSSNLAPDRQKKKEYQKAHLLMELNRQNEAASLLKNRQDLESRRLLHQIYWQQKKWENVMDLGQKILQDSTLSEDQKPSYILSLATAQMNLNPLDQNSMAALRKQWLPHLKGKPEETTFDLITRPDKGEGSYYRDAEAMLKNLDAFKKKVQKSTSE